MHYAVDNNHVECVKLLLFAEEDVPNAKGQRCLAIAKMKYFRECVQLLSQELSRP
ncbi:Chromosome segregation ATPase [Giardia duodenalis]|uniref:Chromosome segregation ATPase n=1 Tax=Giardia intestinalis TaxID=5741 RepID=V6TEU5_GIAIN|nr:Chromosome segregation ATPase [Giardia intestinalis]